jgi:hypothetical protein
MTIWHNILTNIWQIILIFLSIWCRIATY